MSNGRMVYNSKFKAHENGSYLHYPETRHSTIALTEEAVTVMEDHTKETDKPLFMYLSYNAAHSPLQPEVLTSYSVMPGGLLG